jgi:peptidoglycan hydrolase-like protein with peptidoglycan-binding domain
MSTQEQRRRMAIAILNFEARRDAQGRLAVYPLPEGDGGGRYEVAGINEKYNKELCDKLVAMIEQGRFDDAEALAVDFMAQNTDRVVSWSAIPALEFYFRDCCFNRGFAGAGRILQRALGVEDDGAVGRQTRAALIAAEGDVAGLLANLRASREDYERAVAHRDESNKFWNGLVNRWNKALAIAKTFPMTASSTPSELLATPMPVAPAVELMALQPAAAPAVLSAMRVGSRGARVAAWQSFLQGLGGDIGVIDGIFGEHTRDATKAFQEKYGLDADGVAGRQTLLKAAARGFELIEEPAEDSTSSNFPPPPDFPPLTTNAQRESLFGHFDYVSAPTAKNPEAIRIFGTWQQDNIVNVPIPQLRKALGIKALQTMQFHRLAAKQLQGLWAGWEKAKLLDRILSYEGAYVPRFVRGSRTTLSNHAFGSAFDINARYNGLGARPALVGEKGSVRELVSLANDWGFYWGGNFKTRPDGMHFEVAFIIKS